MEREDGSAGAGPRMRKIADVAIPRPSEGLDAYHDLLRSRVYPAVDQLQAEGFVDGYHLINHEVLKLRLWTTTEIDERSIQKVLRAHGLPEGLAEDRRSETGEDLDHFLAMIGGTSAQVRQLIEARDPRPLTDALVMDQG